MKNLLLIVIVLSVLSSCSNEIHESAPPNILFVMTDDHAFQAISAYGSNLIQTPNIDRLAKEGMLFNQAFVSNSICSPSRAVILTGKHSHINGVRDNAIHFDSAQQTFPKLLRQAGYQTAIVGKWHLKSPPSGFDFWQVLPGQGEYYHPDFLTSEGRITEKGFVTDIITDRAIEWLDQKRDSTKPFMLMYQHKAPHREWWPAQRSLAEFTSKTFEEPANLFDDYIHRGTAARDAEMRISDHMGWANDTKLKPELVERMGLKEFLGWYTNAYNQYYNRMNAEEQKYWDEIFDPINEAFEKEAPMGEALIRWKFQRYMQDYLAVIQTVDENLGRMLDYLEGEGLLDNTLIVYTSDQGFYLGEHGWFDKRFMYEESFRTPLIVRWPGEVEPGSVNSDLVQNLDFAQTILEAAGAVVPEDMQGKSLIPLLKGQDVEWRDALYYHYYEYPGIHAVKRHYGVRTDRYKLIHFYHDIDEWELYDLKKDPSEMHNYYGDPAYSDIQNDLHERLKELQLEYGDTDDVRTSILNADLERAEN